MKLKKLAALAIALMLLLGMMPTQALAATESCRGNDGGPHKWVVGEEEPATCQDSGCGHSPWGPCCQDVGSDPTGPRWGLRLPPSSPGRGRPTAAGEALNALILPPAAPTPDVEVGKEGPGWLGENRQGSKAGAPQPASPDADRREMCGH